MIKNMCLVIFTFMSLGEMHFSCAMQIDPPLYIKQQQFATLINYAIEHPITTPQNSISEPPMDEVRIIKKRKSLPCVIISHCKEYAAMNQYKTL